MRLATFLSKGFVLEGQRYNENWGWKEKKGWGEVAGRCGWAGVAAGSLALSALEEDSRAAAAW